MYGRLPYTQGKGHHDPASNRSLSLVPVIYKVYAASIQKAQRSPFS